MEVAIVPHGKIEKSLGEIHPFEGGVIKYPFAANAANDNSGKGEALTLLDRGKRKTLQIDGITGERSTGLQELRFLNRSSEAIQ